MFQRLGDRPTAEIEEDTREWGFVDHQLAEDLPEFDKLHESDKDSSVPHKSVVDGANERAACAPYVVFAIKKAPKK